MKLFHGVTLSHAARYGRDFRPVSTLFGVMNDCFENCSHVVIIPRRLDRQHPSSEDNLLNLRHAGDLADGDPALEAEELDASLA